MELILSEPFRKSESFGKLQNSHQRCSIIKGVFRNFTKFTEKHLCQSLFFNKVAGLRTPFLRTPFLTEHL